MQLSTWEVMERRRGDRLDYIETNKLLGDLLLFRRINSLELAGKGQEGRMLPQTEEVLGSVEGRREKWTW
jgi:hypothetical protein